MDEKDLIVTPFYILLVYLISFKHRSKITDATLKKYFIPALTVKLIGAISLGIVYQFYYSGGDTYNYFSQGSIIYNAFFDSPLSGFRLLIGDSNYHPSIHSYVSQIYWYHSVEYFIVKTSALLSLLCFDNYATVAILFATLSFYSSILVYKVFSSEFPLQKFEIVIAVFFIPSVFFWGSGITKDTLSMIGLSFLLYGAYYIILKKRISLTYLCCLFLSFLILKNTKIYLLLAFIPCFSIWYLLHSSAKIKNVIIRFLTAPIFMIIGGVMAYYGTKSLIEENSRYSINNISNTAIIASLYHNSISTTTEKVKRGHGGSGYGIANFDGTFNGIVQLGVKAINVALYRPYPWEIRNPVMILSALESISLLFLTLLTFKNIKNVFIRIRHPAVIFCLTFALTIALSTGLTAGNFGNLSRYRIPALPFFCIALLVINSKTSFKSKTISNFKFSNRKLT